jgi:hypothetical protein
MVRRGQDGLLFGDDLRQVEVGEVVRALDTANGRVAVVQLTVVDRQRGLKELQLLLERHRIATADAPESAPPADSPAGNGLVAVFVEAPGTQLLSALEELRDRPTLGDMEIHKPITLAALDDSLAGRPHGEFGQRFRMTVDESRTEALDRGERLANTPRPNAEPDEEAETRRELERKRAIRFAEPDALPKTAAAEPLNEQDNPAAASLGASRPVSKPAPADATPALTQAKPTAPPPQQAVPAALEPAVSALRLPAADGPAKAEVAGRQLQLNVRADMFRDEAQPLDVAAGVKADGATVAREQPPKEATAEFAAKKPGDPAAVSERLPVESREPSDAVRGFAAGGEAEPTRPVHLLFVLVTREPVDAARPAAPAAERVPPPPPLPANDGAALRGPAQRTSAFSV